MIRRLLFMTSEKRGERTKDDAKTCFVVMPIRKEGTDEHEHFRALHDTVITPAMRELGYAVTRADDIDSSGSIARDMVVQLATADVVIADLTGVNANVFYELGIRHALRGQGTIMIVDVALSEVPFDLKPYRVIEFTSDLRGVEKLRHALVRFVKTIEGELPDTSKDNPVHDFLPSLPRDIYAHVEGSVEGEMRAEIMRLKDFIRRRGIDIDLQAGQDPHEVISQVLSQAERGQLPVDLVKRARELARLEQRTEFLGILAQLTSGPPSSISANAWKALAREAKGLDLPEEVRLSLLELALELRPRERATRSALLEELAHSENPVHRERARSELLELLGITLSASGDVVIPKAIVRRDRQTVGIMLDAYHRDGLNDEAVAITKTLVSAYPDDTNIIRNHARALQRVDAPREEYLSFYRDSITAPNVNAISTAWFGDALFNAGQLVDAIEAYLLGCILDPDAEYSFISAADCIARVLRLRERSLPFGERDLPHEITIESVSQLLSCGLSCSSLDSDMFELARETAAGADLDGNFVQAFLSLRRRPADRSDGLVLITERERLAIAQALYNALVSDLTSSRSVGH